MPFLRSHPVYLIVATSVSPPLGIGLHGQLPWPPLKADMSFFKRVTTRAPPPTDSLRIKNAVIMGRKTWHSIPKKFRPLPGRINVVVSRAQNTDHIVVPGTREDLLVAYSLPSAISILQGYFPGGMTDFTQRTELGKIFIIGGSEIYRAAVEELLNSQSGPLRIIQTQVRRKDGGAIDCDTFLPTAPGQGLSGTLEMEPRRATAEEVEEWVGEQLPQRGKGNIVKSYGDDADDMGDWLEEGEMQIRVLGEEVTKK